MKMERVFRVSLLLWKELPIKPLVLRMAHTEYSGVGSKGVLIFTSVGYQEQEAAVKPIGC